MLYRRYLFLQGKINGTAKLTKESNGNIKVELTLEQSFFHKLYFGLYVNYGERGVFFPAKGDGQNYSGEAQGKDLMAGEIKFDECSLAVLNSENHEVICSDNGRFALKKEQGLPKVNSEEKKKQQRTTGGLLPFGEVFSSEYGLKWDVLTFDDLPFIDGAAAHIFLNSGAIESINRYGGFYFAKKDEEIFIIGIPSKISKEAMPCLNIFRYMSYLKSRTYDFGCYTIGVNIKKNMIFPVIFE